MENNVAIGILEHNATTVVVVYPTTALVTDSKIQNPPRQMGLKGIKNCLYLTGENVLSAASAQRHSRIFWCGVETLCSKIRRNPVGFGVQTWVAP